MFYAIKSACKCTLKEIGKDNATPIVIDYLNSFSVSSEVETKEAKASGVAAIIMDGARKVSFTMDSEVLTDDQMALMLGGVISGTKITVSETTPTKYYTLDGIFTLTNQDGTETVKKMSFKKIKAQANGELGMNASDISTFTLTCDAMAGEGGVIYEIDNSTSSLV